MSSLLQRLNQSLANSKTVTETQNINTVTVDEVPDMVSDSEEWLESGKAKSSKTVSLWETKIRVVDSYKLVWAPHYFLKNRLFCGVICEKHEILSQTRRPLVDDEIVVELINMDKEGKRKYSRLLIVYEKDLLSYNGNKRNIDFPIDHKSAFHGDNNEQVWNEKLMDRMHNTLIEKYQAEGKAIFDSTVATANALLKLALKEEKLNREKFEKLKNVPEADGLSIARSKVNILDYAPAPKHLQEVQTLSIGDWVTWSQKVFKGCLLCAKIIKFSDDSQFPLVLNTGEIIKGNDFIQKCVPKNEQVESKSLVTNARRRRGAAASSDSSAVSDRGVALYGQEAIDELIFFIDNEGIFRPRGGTYQQLNSFILNKNVVPPKESVIVDGDSVRFSSNSSSKSSAPKPTATSAKPRSSSKKVSNSSVSGNNVKRGMNGTRCSVTEEDNDDNDGDPSALLNISLQNSNKRRKK